MLKILRVYYKFFLKKKFWVGVFVVFTLFAPILDSMSPYFYKLFVDNIPSLNYEVLLKILVAFVIVKAASVLANIVRFIVGDMLNIDAARDAYTAVFKHIHKLDFAYHTTKSSGSLISAIKRGEGAFWSLYGAIHFRIANVVIRFAIMLYFFASIDIRMLMLVSISFIFGLVVSLVFVRFNIGFKNLVNTEEDKISGVVVDNMINFETVKLFAKESWEQNRLLTIFSNWKRLVVRYFLSYRGLDLGMGAVINSSLFVILLYTIKLTVSQQITVGEFVLVATFLQSFYGHLYDLIWGFRDIAKSYTDIEKFFGILDNEVQIKDPQKAVKIKSIKGEVKLKDVTFSYDKGGDKALKDINLEIRQGQSVALVGRSGAGKTTLIKLLLRFFDIDNGKVTIDGVNVKDFKKSQLRSFFGVVPQEPVLFNHTIRYNIAYGNPKATKKEIAAAAKMANIDKFIKSLPEGYRTQVGERGIKLSGGQKQRLAIARMILSDPEIIIFDEATSQLDSESEKLIQDAFWKAAKGKTTIIIAHRLSTVQKADKIIVMEQGKIIEEGSHRALIAKKDSLYNYFWNMQIKME